MSQQIVMSELPQCNFCDQPARYDAVTFMGPWAYMCPDDWRLYRRSAMLGTGFGQRMVLEGEGERVRDHERLPKVSF